MGNACESGTLPKSPISLENKRLFFFCLHFFACRVSHLALSLGYRYLHVTNKKHLSPFFRPPRCSTARSHHKPRSGSPRKSPTRYKGAQPRGVRPLHKHDRGRCEVYPGPRPPEGPVLGGGGREHPRSRSRSGPVGSHTGRTQSTAALRKAGAVRV